MNSLKQITACLIVGLLTGCASTPKIDLVMEYQKEVNSAEAQYDDYDRKMSAIEAIPVPNARAEMIKNEKVAVLTLKYRPASFISMAQPLVQDVKGQPLHRVSNKQLVLVYLATGDNEGIPERISSKMDDVCMEPDVGLMVNPNISKNQKIDKLLAESVWNEIHGFQDPAVDSMQMAMSILKASQYQTHDFSYVQVGPDQPTIPVQVMLHELSQQGIHL